MDLITVRDLFKNTEKYAGVEVNVGGWVRNRRGSKQFGFIVLNDGTYFTPVQVVYNDTLENFQEISKINIGAALIIRGTLVLTPDSKQPFEIRTMVYPGFPTDLQAPMMAVACKTPGTSVFLETIFENRFMHAAELSRLGAHIRVENRVAVVEGTPYLTGAPVRATDLRAGAALVIAGLMAQGTTEIYNTHFIDRGYEHLEEKLNSLGAKISRTRE